MYEKIYGKINNNYDEIFNVLDDIVKFNVIKNEDFEKLMEIREKYPNFHQSNLKTFDEWNELGYRIKKGSVATKLYLDKDYKKSYFDIKQVYPTKNAKQLDNDNQIDNQFSKYANMITYVMEKNFELKFDNKNVNSLNNDIYNSVYSLSSYIIYNKIKANQKDINETIDNVKFVKDIVLQKENFDKILEISNKVATDVISEVNKEVNKEDNNLPLTYRDIMIYCNKYIKVMGFNSFLEFDEFNQFRENVYQIYQKQDMKDLSKACDEASNMMNLSQRKFDYNAKQDNNVFDYEKINNDFNENYIKATENLENLSKSELEETYINIYDKAPFSLRVVGIDENTKVRINCEAIKHIEKHFDNDTRNNLIKQIPSMLANPVCILNGSKDNSYIIVTEIKYNNDNIILPLSYDKNNENIDILNVDTLYEKWNTEYYLEKELTNHNVIAYNKTKMEQFRDPYDRLFLPKGDECSIYDDNITKSLDNVKYSEDKNYYSFNTSDKRFNPVFKASKEEIAEVLKEINYPSIDTYFNDDLSLKKDLVHTDEYRILPEDLYLVQQKLINNRANQIEQIKTYYKSINKYKEIEHINNINYQEVLDKTKSIYEQIKDNKSFTVTYNYVYNDMMKNLENKIEYTKNPDIKDKEIIERANSISDEYIKHWSNKIEEDLKDLKTTKTKHNTKVSSNNKIKDFGEKIGGAKKDLWKEKGISIANLADMNEKEQAKYVIKSNIWIKPNYQELVDNGKEREVVYFYKTVIDALPTTISHNRGATLEEISQDNERFINCINKMKELVYNCNTLEDCIKFKKVLLDNFFEGKTSWSICNKEIYENINLNKVFKAVSHWNYNPRYYISKMKETNFCATESDKILQRFETTDMSIYKFKENVDDVLRPYYIDKGNTRMSFTKKGYESLKDYKYLGYDKAEREFIGANSLEELKQKYKDLVNEKKITEKGRKQIYKYNNIEIKRTGGKEYLSGVATGDDYLNTFKFKGGEFGNWLNDKERQDNLNFAFNSFKDIATALDIRDEDISLNGKLSIAFGSRGSGRALAHYEPLRNVINLTKLKGAGSLAHEYGHFLDNNINELMKNTGTYASETCVTTLNWKGNENIRKAYEQLMTTMKKKVANKEEVEQYRLKEMENCKESSVMNYFARYKDTNTYKKLESLFAKNSYSKNDYINAKNELKDKATDDLEKRAYDLFARNEQYLSIKLQNYYKIKEANFEGIKIDTNYLTMAKDFDKSYSKMGHGYWASDRELFARSFDCYVNDKLLEKGIVNTYLTGHCECAAPIGEERKAINKSFNNLFEEIKKTNLIYKDYLIDSIQVQKENKYTELLDTLKSRYTHQDSFIKSMNSVKDTKGIDVAINKLKEMKREFEHSDAIKNQVKNQNLTL